MAQDNRIYGKDATVFALGSNSYLGVLSSCTVSSSMDTQEAVALKDTSKYPKAVRYGWTMEAEQFLDSTNTGDNKLATGQWSPALARTSVSVSFTCAASGTAYTGTGIITNIVHSAPDGPQTVRVTITGQGALGVA